MKKVGIVTFHEANNYGALLQAAALKLTIAELGYACEIINYKSKAIEDRYRLKLDFSSIKKLIKSMYRLTFLSVRFKKTDSFKKRYISAKKYKEDFDIVFSGSDQVWSYKLLSGDKGYFLDFVKDDKKKASYAASFGISQIADEWKEYYKEQLNHFECISVREQSGADIVKELTGRNAKVVLDPTLLFPREKWVSKFDLSSRKQKYILCYLFGMTKNTCAFIQFEAKKRGLQVRCITDDTEINSRGMKKYRTCSPCEWLELFYNAEMVVTNSFHGIAFSIIFQKEFYVGEIINQTARVRIDNILEICGLTDRTRFQSVAPIDYTAVGIKIDAAREESIKYIHESISQTN